MGMQAQAIEYEKPFAEAREKFEGLIGEMSTASTMQMSHSELEKLVQERGTALLRQMMQDHLELRSLKEERKEVIGQDGKRRGEVKQNERGLMTIFGPVRVNRLGYRGKAARSLHPMDKELNLPKEYYSHGLRRRAAEEAAKSSFDEVIETIKKTTGASLAKRQAEELALRAAEDFEEFYAGRTQQQESKGSILVLSTDAKGVVVRKDDLRKATRKAAEKKNHKLEKRLSKGEKRHRKRQAQVASVYTISPFVRSAEDVVNEFRPLKEAELKRPSPENKRVWASLEQSAKEVIGEAFSEAQRRDPQRKKTWAVLVSGRQSLSTRRHRT